MTIFKKIVFSYKMQSQHLTISLLLVLMISGLFVQCSYHDDAVIPPKTKLLAEVDVFIWSADSNKFLLSSKTQFLYFNGLLNEKYTYSYGFVAGQKLPTEYLVLYETYRYDQFNRVLKVDDYYFGGTLAEYRFGYNGDQVASVSQYNFAAPGQTFSLVDSANFTITAQSKITQTSISGYVTKSVYAYDSHHNASSITVYNNSGDFIDEEILSYDNHPNPYYRPANNFLSPSYFDLEYFDSPNNITTYIIKNGANPEYTVTYVYEYDSDGYPTTSTSNGEPSQVKEVFKYY